MPVEIQLGEVPAGYTATACRKDEEVSVIFQEFTSSEDGSLFISRLEGLPSAIIQKIPGSTISWESQVSFLLAIIRSDATATVYFNELPFTVLIRAKGPIKRGDVTQDQILDVIRLNLGDLTIPADAGLLVVLSHGWRKGLFYDLGPLVTKVPRTFDVGATLGQYYAYIGFQHLFSIEEKVWEEFFRQHWFPFSHLRQSTIRELVDSARSGFPLDDLLDKVVVETKEAVQERLDHWQSHHLLSGHHAFILKAYQHYLGGDYLSASTILLPRIEGVMRTNHFENPAAPKASQDNLVQSTLERAPFPKHNNSLLLPDKFRRYLSEIYFASFDPRSPTGLGRHTVAHGVAPQSACDLKGATLGFLTLLQIVALLPPNSTTQPATE